MSGFTFRKLGIGIAAAGLVAAMMAGCGSRHGRHGHWGHHHGHDPEVAKEHAEDAAEWMLDKVDATDEQQERAKAIITASVDDFVGLAEKHRAQRDAFIDAFSQPAIDREELEKIRQTEMQLADAASARLVTALADVAEVLTPEQRQELLEYARRFHH